MSTSSSEIADPRTVADRVMDAIDRATDERPTPQHSLATIGDSLDLWQAVLEIEEEFDVELPDDVILACETVGDLIAAVEKLQPSVGVGASLREACAAE